MRAQDAAHAELARRLSASAPSAISSSSLPDADGAPRAAVLGLGASPRSRISSSGISRARRSGCPAGAWRIATPLPRDGRDRGGARLGYGLLSLRSLPQHAPQRRPAARCSSRRRKRTWTTCEMPPARSRWRATSSIRPAADMNPAVLAAGSVDARARARRRRPRSSKATSSHGGYPGRSRGRPRGGARAATDRPALGRGRASEGDAGRQGRLLRLRRARPQDRRRHAAHEEGHGRRRLRARARAHDHARPGCRCACAC